MTEHTDRITDHLRRYGSEMSRVVDIFARRNRMPAHDVHALTVIVNAERQGAPATPGDLQRALTLTSGAVTGLVDRLVRAGHVRRQPDERDRRRVRLHSGEAGRRLGQQFFGPLGERTDRIMAARSPAELAVIESFLAEVVGATVSYRRDLSG